MKQTAPSPITIDEIRSAITFKDEQREGIPYHNKLTATFQIQAHIYYKNDHYSVLETAKIREMAEDNLREMIIRKLYENQRRKLFEAIQALCMVDPMNFTTQREAMNKIMEIAGFQNSEFKLDHATTV